MSITLSIKVDASAPVGTLRRISEGLRPGVIGPVRQGLGDAVDTYDRFVQRRFTRLSNYGGLGQWSPLAASTLRRKLGTGRGVITLARAQGRTTAAARGGGNVVRILVERGDLERSLYVGGKNHVRRSIPNGIFTGSTDKKLVFHQHGKGRMHRPVYVAPPPNIAKGMAEDLAVGVRKMMEQAASAKAGG